MSSRSTARGVATARVTLAFAFVFGVLAAAPAHQSQAAAQTAGPAGRWEGVISPPGTELKIALTLKPAAAGMFTGTIDIPAQGARNLPLANVRVDGSNVTFDLPGVPGTPSFKGTLAADGNSIVGNLCAGRSVLPVHPAAER